MIKGNQVILNDTNKKTVGTIIKPGSSHSRLRPIGKAKTITVSNTLLDPYFQTSSGLIGKSGKFYPCKIAEHSKTSLENKHDEPFIIIHNIKHAEFPVKANTAKSNNILATKEQYETLLDYCTYFKVNIIGIAIAYWEWFGLSYQEVKK